MRYGVIFSTGAIVASLLGSAANAQVTKNSNGSYGYVTPDGHITKNSDGSYGYVLPSGHMIENSDASFGYVISNASGAGSNHTPNDKQ